MGTIGSAVWVKVLEALPLDDAITDEALKKLQSAAASPLSRARFLVCKLYAAFKALLQFEKTQGEGTFVTTELNMYSRLGSSLLARQL